MEDLILINAIFSPFHHSLFVLFRGGFHISRLTNADTASISAQLRRLDTKGHVGVTPTQRQWQDDTWVISETNK